VGALAGPRYGRDDGAPALARAGVAQPSSIDLADQVLSFAVPASARSSLGVGSKEVVH